MRIGIDVRHLTGGQPSGVDQYTLAVLRTMTKQHPEHTFVLLTTGSPHRGRSHAKSLLGDILGRRNVTHVHHSIVNRALNLQILLTGRPRLDRLFGKQALGVIWCPNINFIPNTSTPFVATFHDLSFEMMREHYGTKRRWWHIFVRPKTIARKARNLIVPSKTTAMDLANLYGIESEKIHVIPHGVSETFQPKSLPQDHGVRSRHDLPRNYLLHVGTHEPRKNILRLVQAFHQAKNASPFMQRADMKLVLAGSPGEVPVPPSPDVIELGYVPDKDLPTIYRQAQLFLFPSYYEGFGIPILEAFASGTPVITSHTSAMLEVGGPAAIYIDPYNTNDITTAITQLIEDEPLQNHLIQEGLNRIENYHWEKAAEETLKILVASAK